MRLLAVPIESLSHSIFDEGMAVLTSLDPVEAQRVLRFRYEDDRKRALAGRLLWRVVCNRDGLSSESLMFRRTVEGKPYVVVDGNYNFNVSHHGAWVVAISDASRLVGVDIMRYDEPTRGRETFFESMRAQFTEREWNEIGVDLKVFYRFWALKESYIKAIGIGLGFNLQRACFSTSSGHGLGRAIVEIDSVVQSSWEFFCTELDDFHCVAVARGPFAEAHWDFRSKPAQDEPPSRYSDDSGSLELKICVLAGDKLIEECC